MVFVDKVVAPCTRKAQRDMAFWNVFTKATDNEIAASVPLVNDISQVQYPVDNYSNFSAWGYGKNEIVHACIRELADGAASPRYYLGIENDGGIEEIKDSPLASLINRPNQNEDFYAFIERLVTFLQVSGNVYVLKERDRTNQITNLWLLRPDRVSIIPEDRGQNTYIYEIDGKEYALAKEDIAHLALPNPSGDVYGLSPLHVLARTVNLDLNMGDFAKMYFQNAGVPSGLLKIKRRLTSQEEADRIRSRWRSTFGGSNNMHKVAVLDDDAEYQQMASSPKDMALTDLHYMTESRICAVFGVPPILISANVGLARSTFANYREARFSFHSETLEPLIKRIIRFLNHCLQYDYEGEGQIYADMAEMRAFLDDNDSQSARAASLFAAGIITLNEARQLVGEEAMDDGNIRRVPMNIIESSQIEEPVPALPEAASAIEESSSYDEKTRVAPRAAMLRRTLLADREELTERLQNDMERFFRRIKNRVDGTIGRHLERNTDEQKQFPPSFSNLLPDDAENNLGEILYNNFKRVTKSTFARINDSGMAGVLEWSDKLPAVVAITSEASARATIIHNTTKKAFQRVVATALERGYSIEQLARGVPADKFPGIRSVAGETINRARLIARTEIMRTQNLSAIAHYKEQGFEYMRADDVDGDPDDNYVPDGDPYGRTCAERHGQVYRAEDAALIMDHPNGTLNWEPMPRNYQPTEAL